MLANLEKYLLDAVGKEKAEIAAENSYRDIGFDGEQKRLGWVKAGPFSRVKESLDAVSSILEGKQNFIFVGMGGSINGIKPLFTIFRGGPFYALDSLDPAACGAILGEIEDLSKTLVISISKSGTTKETQLLSLALKEVFTARLGKDAADKHFLWLSDPTSFEKLDSLGWDKAKKIPIQFDSKTDVGGRFSSPHTAIFILPLFLLLGGDFVKLEEIYSSFASLQEEIRKRAYIACEKYKDKTDAYFSPVVPKELGESFSSWIVQLFQESLGSKDENLPVKTITNAQDSKDFSPLELDLDVVNPAVSLMSRMYFFQIFIAYYSALKKVNFVTQPFVEKYKDQARELENRGVEAETPKSMDIEEVVNEAKKRVSRKYKFIEVVLYFHPGRRIIDKVREEFNREFEQEVLVFVGSDWNHQSYQAAFADKNTFYILLTLESYGRGASVLPSGILSKNISTLKTIAEATYLTIKDKALFLALSRQ